MATCTKQGGFVKEALLNAMKGIRFFPISQSTGVAKAEGQYCHKCN